MKKFTYLLQVLILVFSMDCFSQTTHVDVDVYLPKHFKVGNRMYASNYRGLNSLMMDLQRDNLEVYENLLPKFTDITKKRNTAIISVGVCGIVGLSMLGIGF